MPTDRLRLTRVPVLPARPSVMLAVRVAPTAGGDDTRTASITDAVLSDEERRRRAEMAPHRAAEFTRGRMLLRQLCAEFLGVPAADVPLRVGPRGALSIAGSGVGVSLSHSARHVAAAYWADGPVGVDVEEPPAVLDDRLVGRCMSAGDAVRVRRCPPPERAARFVRVWTAQEACVKAVGLGLAGRPWSVRVDPYSPGGRWRDVAWMRSDLVAPGAALAVAVRIRRDTEDN